jgi:Holliday junction DNA helicase RuvA
MYLKASGRRGTGLLAVSEAWPSLVEDLQTRLLEPGYHVSQQGVTMDIIRSVIARLHGQVVELEADAVVVDVGGLGYRVHVPTPLLSELGPEGSTVTLHTHLHVRENELSLYGAADRESVQLFELLLGVSGVGPRLAMAILSTYPSAVVQEAIVSEDVALLTHVSGVGKKTAQRLVLDLKAALEKQGVVPGLGTGTTALSAQFDTEAVAALTALGYSTGEARAALEAAQIAPEADLEDKVIAALRVLGKDPKEH